VVPEAVTIAEVVFPNVNVGFRMYALPVVAPKVIVVAAPNPLRVVDTVLNTAIVASPTTDVVNVGVVPNTSAPLPVSPVTAAAKLELDGVAKNVATPEPRPSIPVETGRPVQLVSVPEAGVPRAGVVRVGDVRVLFVRVSAPANVAKVPVVGSVTLVPAVTVRVVANAPDVVKLPPRVIVEAPLLTPVPP
jgi:hypothetical protein